MKKRYVNVNNSGNYPNAINFLLDDTNAALIKASLEKGETLVKLKKFTVTYETADSPHDVVTPYGSILDLNSGDYSGSRYTQRGTFVPFNEPAAQLANLSSLTTTDTSTDKLRFGVLAWSSRTGEHVILSGGFWGDFLKEKSASPDAIGQWVVSHVVNTHFSGSGSRESKVFNLIVCRPGQTSITGHTIDLDRMAPFFCPIDMAYISSRHGSFGNIRIGAEFDKTREEIYETILSGYREQEGIESAIEALTNDTRTWLEKFREKASEKGRTHANFVIINGFLYYGSSIGAHGPAIISDSAFGPLLCYSSAAVSSVTNTGCTICNYTADAGLHSVARLFNSAADPITNELVVQHTRVPLNLQVQVEKLLGWSLRTGEVSDTYGGSRDLVVDLARSSLNVDVLETTGVLNQETATALVNRQPSTWKDAATQGTDETIINSVFAVDIINVGVQPQSQLDNYPAYILALQASLQNRVELLATLNGLLGANLTPQPIEINNSFGKWGT